jgi:transcriptional regulator with PAS, ATPase and Fis domain
VEFRRLKKENFMLRSVHPEENQLIDVVGKSMAMQHVAKKVIKVAKSNVNVMIVGESGTGKELIARNIHYFSSRNDKPFIPVDCVSLPESLLESELFGFEKGAFTGAIKSRPGVFELAHGGTLFLDEITELDVQLQTKLLRVLQERHLRRIGGNKLIDVDVRIISATNRNPEKAVEENKLREDLYYRLNVVPVNLPSLRERKEDIPLLVKHFIKKYSGFSPIEFTEITKNTMRCLQNYAWPGNIRELENIIQRIISLAEEPVINLKYLPDEIVQMETASLDFIDPDVSYKESKKQSMQIFEKRYLEKLLDKYQGNLSLAANKAGMSRQTLYNLIKMHGLPFDTSSS